MSRTMTRDERRTIKVGAGRKGHQPRLDPRKLMNFRLIDLITKAEHRAAYEGIKK